MYSRIQLGGAFSSAYTGSSAFARFRIGMQVELRCRELNTGSMRASGMPGPATHHKEVRSILYDDTRKKQFQLLNARHSNLQQSVVVSLVNDPTAMRGMAICSELDLETELNQFH